jgi:hypothetical protein
LAVPEFRVTVATVPTSEILVASEVRLAKSALLYADHVTIASGNAAMIDAASRLLDASPATKTRQLIEIASVLADPAAQAAMKLMTGRRFRRHAAFYAQVEAQMSDSIGALERTIGGFSQQSGITELEGARAAGLLDIDPLGLDPVALLQDSVLMASGRTAPGSRDKVVAALIEAIATAASLRSTTYPLFDDGANDLARTMIRAGMITDPSVEWAGQSGLASHFVGQLPAFPGATMSEILDLRGVLRPTLVRFRSALVGMTNTIELAPWEPEFVHAADDLWRSDVAPALADLEQNARDAGAFSLLGHAASSPRPYAAGGATLILGFTAASSMPAFAAAAIALGAPLVTAATAAVEVAKRRMQLSADANNNRFLFLYRAGIGLSNASKR